MTAFKGIWVPLVTPFVHNTPHLDRLQKLATKLVDDGVHGLVVCGTTGEGSSLNETEQRMVLHAVVEAVPARYPVLMGLSGSDTQSMVQKAARFDQDNCTGFLLSAPSYVRPSQEGIRQHVKAIAAATDKPIVLYNIPSRTGVNMDAATVVLMAQIDNVVAIKDCSGNLAQMAEILKRTSLSLMCGDDALLTNVLSLGSQGAISAAAHIRPDLFIRVYDLIRCGDLVSARLLFNKLLPLIQLLFSEPNPVPVKTALAMLGMIREDVRLPMTPMSKAGRTGLQAALAVLMDIPRVKTSALRDCERLRQLANLAQ